MLLFFPPPPDLSSTSLCLCPSHLCSGEPDECSCRSVVRARAHPDITVWLSRTLAQGIWACCNVTVAAGQHYETRAFDNDRFLCLFLFLVLIYFFFNAHPPYMPFQPALWLSLCLSLLACNASWVELWSKHQDKQKAMEKPQSKTFYTPKKINKEVR